MILPSRRALRWRLVGLALAAAVTAGYVRYARGSTLVHGGTPEGIVYGIAATVLVFVLMAFGIRKRAYRSTWGTLDGWLQAHLYLGLLCAVVVLFHAGFRFRDKVATAAAVVLFAVVASGLVGARLYTSLPRRLTRVQSNLTVDEISEKLNQLSRSMARLAAPRSPLFQRFAERLAEKTRPPALAGWRLLLGRPAAGRPAPDEARKDWGPLLEQLADEEREPMRQLLMLYRQHRELHLRLQYQQRYKNLLESWLYLHLPLSFVLLLLIAVHVIAVFYFGAL